MSMCGVFHETERVSCSALPERRRALPPRASRVYLRLDVAADTSRHSPASPIPITARTRTTLAMSNHPDLNVGSHTSVT
ncbi:jg9300 [Pararge aegeria aegeria]|uniref:Jg9300 protein n=1 Tax=Pararge aegeria aegeria TaxID=348720 RepID=A0A8S4SHX2_9NEOP|nr:jg9300 [Pararge aegeria aegeria]